MRILTKVFLPAESAKARLKDGTFVPTFKSILDDIKPEAVYCVAENGMRAMYIFLNLNDPSEVPAVAEPFFLAFNAKVDFTLARIPGDLMKAGPEIEKVVEKYA